MSQWPEKANTDFIIESVDKKSTLSNATLLSKFLISVTNPIVFFGSLFEQHYTHIHTVHLCPYNGCPSVSAISSEFQSKGYGLKIAFTLLCPEDNRHVSIKMASTPSLVLLHIAKSTGSHASLS